MVIGTRRETRTIRAFIRVLAESGRLSVVL